MSIATIIPDFKAFKDALVSRKPSPILRTAAPVLVDGADIIDLFDGGVPLFGAAPDDKAECKCLVDDITTELQKAAAEPPVVAAGPVGKLFPGDGSFLKAMLELFLKLAPLFIEPAPTP